MFVRNVIFCVLSLILLLALAACPAKKDDAGGEGSPTASTSGGNAQTPPLGAGMVSSTGGMQQPPLTDKSGGANVGGQETRATDGGATTTPVKTHPPTGTNGKPLETFKGEIAAIDVKAKTVEIMPEGADKTRLIKMPLSDTYPKCPTCDDDKPVKVGDKGEYYVEVSNEGAMTFVGVKCDCENPGDPNCTNCQKHKDAGGKDAGAKDAKSSTT